MIQGVAGIEVNKTIKQSTWYLLIYTWGGALFMGGKMNYRYNDHFLFPSSTKSSPDIFILDKKKHIQ